MNKYINAGKLIKSVNRYRDNAKAAFNPIEDDADYYKGKIAACEDIQKSIISFQQEQPEDSKGKFVFPKFLYARTLDNKTIDVSYAPQSMDAIEYVRNNSAEVQLEVDFDKELKNKKATLLWDAFGPMNGEQSLAIRDFARYFYELGRLR